MKNKKTSNLFSSMLLILITFISIGCSSINKVDAKDYAIIDLHLHLDGSLSIKSVKELMELNNIEGPNSDEELLTMLQVDDDCRDLNEYLEKFNFPVSLLQTKETLSLAVHNLEKELKKLGLLYAEIRFAPQLHTLEGLTQEEVVEATIEGMSKCEFKSNLILCCMRGENNHKENIETVQVAKKYLNQGVAAIDIAGAEALYPTENFFDIFELAVNENVPFTIHAGEADGPSSVYQAIEFGTKRIGHGVRSYEDDELIEKLVDENITLELCPTSNINTNIFNSLEEYPLNKFLSKGVKVTINSDNMMVSDTNVKKEYQKMFDIFNLTKKELNTLTKNSIEASFLDEESKSWLLDELNKIHK